MMNKLFMKCVFLPGSDRDECSVLPFRSETAIVGDSLLFVGESDIREFSSSRKSTFNVIEIHTFDLLELGWRLFDVVFRFSLDWNES